LSIFA
jgi:hypothetical protein